MEYQRRKEMFLSLQKVLDEYKDVLTEDLYKLERVLQGTFERISLGEIIGADLTDQYYKEEYISLHPMCHLNYIGNIWRKEHFRMDIEKGWYLVLTFEKGAYSFGYYPEGYSKKLFTNLFEELRSMGADYVNYTSNQLFFSIDKSPEICREVYKTFPVMYNEYFEKAKQEVEEKRGKKILTELRGRIDGKEVTIQLPKE